MSNTGHVQFLKNGFLAPHEFTGNVGPFALQDVLVTSSAGGSVDLSAGQAFDWTRYLGWGRALTDGELTSAFAFLGTRYGIATATSGGGGGGGGGQQVVINDGSGGFADVFTSTAVEIDAA